jgi:hypothetical protein
MTPSQKEELQKEFATYLRNSINQLPNTDLPKEFKETNLKITVATIRNYCSRVLQENKELVKIQRIKEFYDLKGEPTIAKEDRWKLANMSEIDKLLEELEQNKEAAKPIANLFKGTTEKPSEEILSFAAFLINLPINNLDEFRRWKATKDAEAQQIYVETQKLEEENQNINPTNKETTTTINDTKIVIETPKTFFQQHKYKFTIAASIILLVVCSAYAYNLKEYYDLKSYVNENKEKLATIEQISFKPIIADSGLVENITKSNITNQNIDNQVVTENSKQIIANVEILEMPLSFYTNNIYNGKFLFTTDKWNFETDITGEDMNSKYGEPYRNQLKSLQKLPNTQPTIANKSIWIRFNVMNKSNTKLYVDNIKLEKVATHAINNKIVKWSNWITPKDGEKRFELALSHEPQIVAVVPFTEIAANSPQHFSLIINCDKTCENYIYKFKLVVSTNDGQGNRYNVSSDRVYTLGLVSEL